MTAAIAESSWATVARRYGYGELAVALSAAGPLPPHPADDVLAALAEQGARRLGGAAKVREMHERWRDLNQRHELGLISPQEYERALGQLFPDLARLEACVLLDFQRLQR